jgi:UDP-N-acetylmuramyl pentapeptide synthase
MVDGARTAGMAFGAVLPVPDAAAALAALRGRLGSGDVVLVKASNGVQLWHLVDDLVQMLGGSGEDPRP